MSQKPTRLKELEVSEVSVVRRPANQRAGILFHKQADGTTVMSRIKDALAKAFKIATTGMSPDGKLLSTEEEQVAAIDKELGALADLESTPTETDPMTTAAALTKEQADAIQKENDDLKARLTKADEAVAAATAKADKATEAVEKLIASDQRKTMLAKAHTLAEGIPDVKDEDVADVLAKLDEPTTKTFEKITNAVRTFAKSAKLMVPLGESLAKGDAQSQINDLAKSFRAADPKLTEQQALAKAYSERPELYAAITAPVTN